MFSLREFVKNGFIKAVGKMADYQIILNAAGWLEKGVLDESDLAEIQSVIDAQYPVIEESEDVIGEGNSVIETDRDASEAEDGEAEEGAVQDG